MVFRVCHLQKWKPLGSRDTGEAVSGDKARKELGWQPKVDFEEGPRRYIEWYKKNMR